MIRQRRVIPLMALVLLLAASLVLPAAGQTTSLTVTRYGFDRVTVAESRTVDVSWMATNLPVQGDGVTPYYMQGITWPTTDVWNPTETLNITKLNETLKGTAIRDLVELVGGMHPGDEVEARGVNGTDYVNMWKRLSYENVYAPPARQGPPVLAWWNQRDGYAWNVSMRLFFLADTSTNPYGWHVFGNEDMRQCIAKPNWQLQTWALPVYPFTKLDYPSAAGLSVKNVTELWVLPPPRAVPGATGVPTNTDSDRLYDDVNGNGRTDFADVVLYFNQIEWIAANEPLSAFDYNGNGRVDFADVIWLFGSL